MIRKSKSSMTILKQNASRVNFATFRRNKKPSKKLPRRKTWTTYFPIFFFFLLLFCSGKCLVDYINPYSILITIHAFRGTDDNLILKAGKTSLGLCVTRHAHKSDLNQSAVFPFRPSCSGLALINARLSRNNP